MTSVFRVKGRADSVRILIFHLHDERYRPGGADRGVLDLAAALQNQPGHEIRIIANRGPFSEEAAKKNLSVVFIPRSKTAMLETLKTIRREIRSFRPQVMHSHHRYLTFLLDIFFKQEGIPILHTQRIQAWDKRFLFRYGHFVTTVSESLRKHMISYYRVPENRIRAIVNAVSVKAADPQAVEALKQKYPRRSGDFFALCVGRFHEQKGHVYLIGAVKNLNASLRKRLKIFLAGDGPLEDALKEKIRQMNLEDNFIFCGYAGDIAAYHLISDCFILPSLWEGLPRVVLEAFAMGRPAIATDIPGTCDVIEPGRNGLLVPPRSADDLAKALENLMEHPEKLTEMQAEAAASAKKYSFAVMVQNYLSLYEELQKRSFK
jgi:glycosyltransferase involved in cell wall biosynthesis